MKFNIKHLGDIEGGKMIFDDPKTYLNVIKGLEGARVEVVIKKALRQQSRWMEGLTHETTGRQHRMAHLDYLLNRVSGHTKIPGKIVIADVSVYGVAEGED